MWQRGNPELNILANIKVKESLLDTMVHLLRPLAAAEFRPSLKYTEWNQAINNLLETAKRLKKPKVRTSYVYRTYTAALFPFDACSVVCQRKGSIFEELVGVH